MLTCFSCVPQRGRVLLLDMLYAGTVQSTCKETTGLTPGDLQGMQPQLFQLYPYVSWDNEKGKLVESDTSQLAFHGCHADPYADDTLRAASLGAPAMDHYMVCMSYNGVGGWWLMAFKLTLYTSESMHQGLNSSNAKMAFWIDKAVQIAAPADASAYATSVLPYAVHVIGKKLVLYRCKVPNVVSGTVASATAYWCWRTFEYNKWGSERYALTTAVLSEGVLQKGMFIGWATKESYFAAQDKIAYFLDRGSSRLFTLRISRDLDAVVTDMVIGITSTPGFEKPLEYSLLNYGQYAVYGQVYYVALLFCHFATNQPKRTHR